MSDTADLQGPIRTTIPARLDRLGWSPFHTRMVAGLGAAWILDGLQITIASSVTGVLTEPSTLDMTSTEVGLIASVYLIGQLIGALVFGRMSDQLGRKRLLVSTLLLYLFGTGLAAFVTGHHTGWLVFFYATRLIAGMGIGGQYAAINSAIDEMMPSKYRGRVDIWINGVVLGRSDPRLVRLADLPQRLRRERRLAAGVPDGPGAGAGGHRRGARRCRRARAGCSPTAASRRPRQSWRRSRQRRAGRLEPVSDDLAIELVPEKQYGYLRFLRLVFHTYPKRAILGATLMITQSFLYNAIFFTYALVLTQFYDVSATRVPLYGLAFSVGNLAGPLAAGPAFRHRGPQEDDLGDLHPVRDPARRQRLPVRRRRR